MKHSIISAEQNNTKIINHDLKLSYLELSDEYRKEWKANSSDYVCLMINDKIINETSIYRRGGFFNESDLKNDYFILLKQVESRYSDEIMEMCKDEDMSSNKYLDNCSCIIDKYGNEKVVTKKFSNTYLVKNSCIYSMNSNYYNIETGELYCNTRTSMESEEFLFLDNRFDKDKSRRGVMKIHKKTGEFEIFKGE